MILEPRILKISNGDDARAALLEAARVLAGGGVVVYPTETLYGLAADHANPAALEKLFILKNRPMEKPFPLILSGPEEFQAMFPSAPDKVLDLVRTHWPGPLTLVLPAPSGLSPHLLGAGGGLAVRLSSHPIASGLASALGRAITATSANLSGRPAVSRFADLDPALIRGADLCLDAGDTPGGPPSTLVDFTSSPPRILRRGALDLDL